MRIPPSTCLLICLAAHGCHSVDPADHTRGAKKNGVAEATAPTPQADGGARPRKEDGGTDRRNVASRDPVMMGPFRVEERRHSNFGISVATEEAPAQGGAVRWVRVTSVDKEVARALDISVGYNVFAIDGRMVTTMSNSEVVTAISGKPSGAQVRLLLWHPQAGVPRFVTLRDLHRPTK